MEPYVKNKKRKMGGTKDAYQDMLRKDKKAWAERKRQTRREKRRIDKKELTVPIVERRAERQPDDWKDW
jgi:hypothetical protein